MAKQKSDNEQIQADLDWIFWGGVLGAVFSMVGGWRAGAHFLGLLGAFIGAIVAAPLGVLVGCLLGWFLRQLFDLLFVLVALPFVVLLTLLRRWRPQIGSLVACPDPVTTGNSLTLTGSKIRVTYRHATIDKVAFYVHIKGTKTLLGYGTQTSSEVWTLNLTVSLSPGAYPLVARAWDSYGRSSQGLRSILTVQ